jgi:hypothetical protein
VPDLKQIRKHFLAHTLSVEASTKTDNCRILQTDNQVREGAFPVRHLKAVFFWTDVGLLINASGAQCAVRERGRVADFPRQASSKPGFQSARLMQAF